MFETKKKFLNLVESSLTRAKNAGYLVGDYVTLDKKMFTNKLVKKWHDALSDDYKAALDEMSKDGKKLRIAELNTPIPQSFGLTTGTDVVGLPRFATIYEEIAANLWGNVVVVPVAVLKIVKLDGNNITPGNPTYQQGEITDKPVPVKTDGENHNLTDKNTTLPSGKRSDGRDQAKKPEEK